MNKLERLMKAETLVCGFLGHEWEKSEYVRVKNCKRCRAILFQRQHKKDSIVHSPSPREKENQE